MIWEDAMRLSISAFFLTLILIPVAQVMADTLSDKSHLYIWNGYHHPPAIANRHLSKEPNPSNPKLHREKTS
jgi:hypothetical protein